MPMESLCQCLFERRGTNINRKLLNYQYVSPTGLIKIIENIVLVIPMVQMVRQLTD